MHGFYTTIIDFCRAIITENQLDLLPFQAQFHLESIIARSNDFSNYITREDTKLQILQLTNSTMQLPLPQTLINPMIIRLCMP